MEAGGRPSRRQKPGSALNLILREQGHCWTALGRDDACLGEKDPGVWRCGWSHQGEAGRRSQGRLWVLAERCKKEEKMTEGQAEGQRREPSPGSGPAGFSQLCHPLAV